MSSLHPLENSFGDRKGTKESERESEQESERSRIAGLLVPYAVANFRQEFHSRGVEKPSGWWVEKEEEEGERDQSINVPKRMIERENAARATRFGSHRCLSAGARQAVPAKRPRRLERTGRKRENYHDQKLRISTKPKHKINSIN